MNWGLEIKIARYFQILSEDKISYRTVIDINIQ